MEPGVELAWNWHMDAIIEHLEAALNGQIHRLVVNLAPGHAKSTIFSVALPAWCWTFEPTSRWLCASHSLDLAMRDNSNCRALIESEWYQSLFSHTVHIKEDQNQKGFFENTQRGYRMCTSVGAKGTGKRATHLLIDDPNDSRATQLDLEATKSWFGRTWMSRLNDMQFGTMITVGQRIHQEDLTGHIRKLGWECLSLPSEFEPTTKCFTSIGWSDPRTEEGELLWPEKFPKEVLDSLKAGLGSINYAAQYQQSPVPSDGGQFKSQWIRYFSQQDDAYILHTPNGNKSILKAECWRFTVVDLAISSKQSADYTVIQTWDVTPQNDLLLIDQVRGRFDNPTQQRIIKQVYVTLNPRFIKIESVGYQLALIQQLRDEPTANNEFLVSVGNPEALENTFKQLGWADASLVKHPSGFYKMVQDYYVVRVLGDANFFVFACENQGYCKIIDKSEVSKFSIPIREFRPTRDKVSRASTPAIQMENGKMYFEQCASYVTDLVSEVLMFPKGAHDDQIDCLSQAADEVIHPRGPIMWSVGEDAPPCTLEMAELPENKQYQLVEIEKFVSEDEGDFFESEAY